MIRGFLYRLYKKLCVKQRMRSLNMIQESDCPSERKDDFSLLFCGDTFLRTRDGADPFSLILSHFENARVCVNLETSLKGSVKKKKLVLLSVEEKFLARFPEQVLFVNIVNNPVCDEGEPRKLMEALQKRVKVLVCF